MLHAMVFAAIFSESKIPVRTCYHERHRVGTGLPLADKTAVAEDKNLITSVAPVLLGAGGIKSGAVPIGYVITLVTGDHYYEFGSGLTRSQQWAELILLLNARANRDYPNLLSLIQADSSAVIRLKIPPSAYARSRVHVEPCAALTERELDNAKK